MIEFDETIVGIWYIKTARDQDFMLGLNIEDDHFRMRYRFRYYHPDSSDPFDGKDEKNWFSARVNDDRKAAIDKMGQCMSVFAVAADRMFGSNPAVYAIVREETETLDHFLDRFKKAPFVHFKELSEEEAKTMGSTSEGV